MTKWRTDMAAWVAEFHWDFFCTLTFRPYFSVRQRQHLMRDWIKDVEHKFGDLNWFAVPELGKTGEDHHFHILIGGVGACTAGDRQLVMNLWTSGNALVTEFNPRANGIAYILKDAGPETEIEFEICEGARMQANFGE